MKKILVINGPNLNMLGIREPEIYGHTTYAELEDDIRQWAAELGVEVRLFQSNHEGAIIDEIQAAYGKFDGIVVNPAGYTHTLMLHPLSFLMARPIRPGALPARYWRRLPGQSLPGAISSSPLEEECAATLPDLQPPSTCGE